jgi:hypothetical protein
MSAFWAWGPTATAEQRAQIARPCCRGSRAPTLFKGLSPRTAELDIKTLVGPRRGPGEQREEGSSEKAHPPAHSPKYVDVGESTSAEKSALRPRPRHRPRSSSRSSDKTKPAPREGPPLPSIPQLQPLKRPPESQSMASQNSVAVGTQGAAAASTNSCSSVS